MDNKSKQNTKLMILLISNKGTLNKRSRGRINLTMKISS